MHLLNSISITQSFIALYQFILYYCVFTDTSRLFLLQETASSYPYSTITTISYLCFIKVSVREWYFFTIIGVIAPTLPRIPTFCKTGLTRAYLPAKPLPVFSVKKGTNPSGVSRFRLRELPHNPQKSINNDGIRMSICIYYHCLAERNYSSPPFSFHI